MKNLKRLWKYFRGQKFYIIMAMVCSSIVSATDGAAAYIVKDILDGIFINKDVSMLKLIPLLMIAIYLVRFVGRIFQSYFIQYAGYHAVQQVREALYEKLIYMPMRFYDNNDTGALMTRIINDVAMLHNAIPAALKIFRSGLSVFFLIGVVMYQDPVLGSSIFVAIPVMAYIIDKTGRKVKQYSKKRQEKISELGKALQETLTGISVVKSFANEEKEEKTFFKLNGVALVYRLKQVLVTSLSSPFMESLAGFAAALILFYGGLKVINGETTPGTFFSFLTAFGLMFEPFKNINNDNVTVQSAIAASERIFEIIDTNNDILENDGTIECDAKGKDITFENVSFAYNAEDGDVLKGINLTVKSGSTVALVGASGAGKSTIASIIPRFYDIREGSVKIGSTDIRDFKVHSLRRNIGIVSQDTFLFNTSLRENIAYGTGEDDMEKIRAAADSAFALQFIEELEEGFDTLAGQRGDRLSGGQKQRVTIARALLSNPPLLILDEATSALDTESERMVQQALTNLMKGRTSIVIAHRLSTILNADMIVVLENGEIQATGTHDELLKKSEIYARLCELQFTTTG
jgi:subfamily B ATP-binding cassette protein MsbA